MVGTQVSKKFEQWVIGSGMKKSNGYFGQIPKYLE